MCVTTCLDAWVTAVHVRSLYKGLVDKISAVKLSAFSQSMQKGNWFSEKYSIGDTGIYFRLNTARSLQFHDGAVDSIVSVRVSRHKVSLDFADAWFRSRRDREKFRTSIGASIYDEQYVIQ